MEPIRLGIVGCGVIGEHHMKLAAESRRVEVVAVADVVEDRARGMVKKFSISSCYDNDEDLLRDDRVEAVILAMPTGVRLPVACKALKLGKHILLEKPVAMNVKEVEQIMALRGDRVVACCSSRKVFTGHAEAAGKCIASGVLGQIRLVRVRAVHPAPAEAGSNPPPWRQSMEQNGGGILVNWSSYDLDYLMNITGWELRPRVVLARWWPVADQMSGYVDPDSDADSHYTAFILCEDDIVLDMERGEFSSARIDQAWEIIGTEGSLHLPMVPQKGNPDAVILDKFIPGEGVVSETIWEKNQGNPDDNVIEDFARAIQEGGHPKTNLERALVMQKITDAIYASAESGACVSIS